MSSQDLLSCDDDRLMQKYKDELKTKKRRKFLVKIALFLATVVVAAIGLSYLLFFVRLLDIRTVQVEAPDNLQGDLMSIADEWLDKGWWQFTRRNNIFLVSADKLVEKLTGQFPKLETIRVNPDFPHALVISAVERKSVGVWCITAKNFCFYFDKNGVAFEETQKSSGFLILTVTDKRNRELALGGEVVEKEWLTGIINSRELLAGTGVNVSEFIIPADSFDEFHAKTAEGWKIMFSIQTNIEKQISSLATFLKEKIKPDRRSGLQYVDLRIQDRIYYK